MKIKYSTNINGPNMELLAEVFISGKYYYKYLVFPKENYKGNQRLAKKLLGDKLVHELREKGLVL